MSLPSIGDLPLEQRRIIRAWCMYDWANSAFATSIAAIVPIYFVFLFKEAAGDDGTVLGIFTGSSMWSLGVALSTGFVAFSSPVLGVIADRVPIRRVLLATYMTIGSVFTMLAFFAPYAPEPWVWMFVVFTVANIGFVGSIVFYNSFLPHLGPRHLLDDISSRGYAYGYLGGGLLLVVHLAFILATRDTDLADLATRLSIASVGLWWFGWATWTLRVVPEPPVRPTEERLTPFSAFALGFRELRRTFREIRRFRVAVVFLIAYLLFNDGISTVTAIAGAYAADTLAIPLVFNMGTVATIQFVAVPGALAFAWLADRIATKPALTVALVGWIGIVIVGVSLAPLPPTDHGDFDFQFAYREASGDYVAEVAPDLDDGYELRWRDHYWRIEEGYAFRASAIEGLAEAMRDAPGVEYAVSVRGGPLDGASGVGESHPSMLGDGPVDWWPSLMRDLVWAPLGLAVGPQWLLLGAMVGWVIGGSQALARSLFAQVTPERRSGEFFAFFGFIGRASSVFGPTVYIAATALFDTRVAVMSILFIILAGTIVLGRVDVDAGARTAAEEDARISEG
ncbi:MAG: MFS transporter [Chloroflexota bacterium]|nr:MFS transporter [Chloroflexota bacterium]